jgi:hypothetical protein
MSIAGGNYGAFRALPNMNPFGNLRGAGMGDVQNALGQLPISGTMKSAVLSSKAIEGKLPGILEKVLGQQGVGGETPSGIDVSNALVKELGQFNLPEEMQNQLHEIVQSFFGEGGAKGGFDPQNISKLSDKIQGAFSSSVKAAEDVYKAMYDIRSEFLKSLEEISKISVGLVAEGAQTKRNFAEIGLRKHAAFVGTQPTLGQTYRPFQAEAGALLGAGMGRNVPIGMQHGAGSVGAAFNEYNKLTGIINTANTQMTKFGTGTEGGMAAASTLAEATSRQDVLAQYLKLMSTDTTRLVGIEGQLLQIENRREAAKGGLSDLMGSNPLQRMKMVQQLMPVLEFQATGRMPQTQAGLQNYTAGLGILQKYMDKDKFDELETRGQRAWVGGLGVQGLTPNGGIMAAINPRGQLPIEKKLDQEWNFVVEGVKEAFDKLSKIKVKELSFAADVVYLQYQTAEGAINREIPKFGAIQEKQNEATRANVPQEIRIGGNIGLNITGLDAMVGLEPGINALVIKLVNNAIAKHIDLNTGETKPGNPNTVQWNGGK